MYRRTRPIPTVHLRGPGRSGNFNLVLGVATLCVLADTAFKGLWFTCFLEQLRVHSIVAILLVGECIYCKCWGMVSSSFLCFAALFIIATLIPASVQQTYLTYPTTTYTTTFVKNITTPIQYKFTLLGGFGNANTSYYTGITHLAMYYLNNQQKILPNITFTSYLAHSHLAPPTIMKICLIYIKKLWRSLRQCRHSISRPQSLACWKGNKCPICGRRGHS